MVSEESESALGRSSVASPTSPYRVSGAPPPRVDDRTGAVIRVMLLIPNRLVW